MSIASVGSGASSNLVLAAFAESQARAAIREQEDARRAENERLREQATAANTASLNRNRLSDNADAATELNNDARNNANGINANNGPTNNPISRIAAQFDIDAQINRNAIGTVANR